MAKQRTSELAQSEHADDKGGGHGKKEPELRDLRQRLYNQGRKHIHDSAEAGLYMLRRPLGGSQAVMSRVTNRSAVVRPDILWAITFCLRRLPCDKLRRPYFHRPDSRDLLRELRQLP
jgi:hypothetical protein